MERIDELLIKGIEDGKKAFIGPRVVQIDLTGRCNNNCIGCWVHSPYIKKPPRDKNVVLSFDKVKELVEELSFLGTQEIFLSGAGEPFLHPNILEILEIIKNKNLKINLITNFTLINGKIAQRLIELEVDLITASIWAATPETYIKTHPGKTEEDFCKIKDNLRMFSQLKLEQSKYLPHIKIYNVICNLNYREIHQMIDFALDTGVEFIEFQIMDIVENETSFLALSNSEIEKIKKQFLDFKKNNNLFFREIELFNIKCSKEKEFAEFFGRFIRVPQNFLLKEWIKEGPSGDITAYRSLECFKVATLPTSTNPKIEDKKNKIIFKFPEECCRDCPYFKNACIVDDKAEVDLGYLKILGWGSFMRRLNSSNIYEQIYEKDIIDSTPCFIGWVYSRILSTGEVIPCCKAALKPFGNIHKKKFVEIWNFRAYQKFRYMAKNFPKHCRYFKKIDCYKSCDNVGLNLEIKELISRKKEPQNMNYFKGPIKRMVNGFECLPKAETKIIIPAINFKSGNLNPQKHPFGKAIVIDGGHGFGWAEYEIYFKESGRYELWSFYASGECRPVEIYFRGVLIKKEGLNSLTYGWNSEDLLWFKESELDVPKGKHIFRIYTQGLIPHIHSFAFLKGVKEIMTADNFENVYKKEMPLKLLWNKVNTFGLCSSTKKLFYYIRSGRLLNHYLDIIGIFNGEYAFTGPFHVQIDLTNNCNNNCIGCWCNSTLLGEKAMPPGVKRQSLSFDLVKELLDELSQMGTKEIYFSGGGEPFMHHQIMEILTLAKKKGFICYINTNFTLLDREKILKLIDIGVDHFTVSTWSATPKTYALTHPNKTEETFLQIKENLKFLNSLKRKTPFIKLYNVIFNLNYYELNEMIKFAKETGSESVEFTLLDTIPGKTDRLLLNPDEIKELQKIAQGIAEKLDSRGYLDGVLLFRFDSFLRRISSASDLAKATYDRNIIDKIPCYIGFCFSRIMPNGDVNPCLKAHRIPTGNLYQARFSEIWNGEKQREFRKKTLVYEKKDPFFKSIGNDAEIQEAGCYKSCDDIGRNIYMHNRIMSLTPLERSILKIISQIRKKPKFNLENGIEDLLIKGIVNGRKAFIGPEQVVIDITNRCNERCIGCWLYSPLLKEKPTIDWLKQEINLEKAKKIIDELANLGTKRIRFTGGGEPFMHPKIMDLIEYTKLKGLVCCLTTNFSILNKKQIKELIRLGVDELAISLWASNGDTYQKTHPGVFIDAFEKIKENLMILTNEKKSKPFVTLCNVICNLNYLELEEMFNFALNMKVDGIYFTLVDTIKGATDCLILDEKQKQEVLKEADIIQKIWQDLPQEKRIKLDYFEGFISRLKDDGSLVGNYDQVKVNQIPCYVGWIFARILADGNVVPCCRGVKKPMGNVNDENFKDIWFSQKYNEFRAKAKYLPKTHLYFSDIGCIKMCDNLMHNEQMHSQLRHIL